MPRNERTTRRSTSRRSPPRFPSFECAGFVPVLQQRETKSNLKRIAQTVLFIGLRCWESGVVATDFALENRCTGNRTRGFESLFFRY